MRTFIAAALLITSLTGGAWAQTKAWTPAPVPNADLTPRPAPADRAGRPDGAERAAPFSGLPSSVAGGSSQATSAGTGIDTRANATPSLSR